MTLHNYRCRQVHETLNGINPSSTFRNMRLQSLDPICGKFDKFLAHGQAHMGQMGKWTWQCTTTGLDNSIELRMEKIHLAITEIWVPQVWQPPARPHARQPARPTEPWVQYPSSPEGWGVKKAFIIKNEIEAEGLSRPKSIGILTVLRCISGPNLVILA